MTMHSIITIFLIIMALIALVSGIYIYLRNRSLEEIRADVYQLFLRAENMYLESGTGKQKMEYVIQRARSMLPGWLQLFLTDELLYRVVQVWFDAVKDLLDDGKYNKSIT